MLPLMEMLKLGGNGEAVEWMARQFDISREQTEAAMEALMPAFSEGLRRNAADPTGFFRFMEAISAGQHANYFDHPDAATTRDGIAEGNAILGHLFGSKEMSRAVAQQAAIYSGLSEMMLRQMLPMLAPMILGGLFKQMSGGMPHSGRGTGAGDAFQNPLGWVLEQMAGGSAPAGRSTGNPWTDMLEQMMGGATGGRGGGDNPMGQIFEEMMRGGAAANTGRQGGDRRRRPQGGGLEDLFGEMFDTGRAMQKEYQNQMESIFDSFLGSKGR